MWGILQKFLNMFRKDKKQAKNRKKTRRIKIKINNFLFLIFLFSFSHCVPIEIDIEEILEESPPAPSSPKPAPKPTISASPTLSRTPTECPVPANTHTECYKCPLLIDQLPKEEDVKRYLRFGTGKGHVVYTPSGHHSNRYTLLLSSTFGIAQSVQACGNKGCSDFKLSNQYKPQELGFANDCRQHWKYEGNINQLENKTGRKSLYFRVCKSVSCYNISLPNGATFRSRIE